MVKSAEFATEEWVTATAAPQKPVTGTESISFPGHDLQIFSQEVLRELEADMRDVSLQAAREALAGQEVDCQVDLHEGEPRADHPIPVSASTTFHVGALGPFMSSVEAEAESLVCLLYTSPSPRDQRGSRMPSSA